MVVQKKLFGLDALLKVLILIWLICLERAQLVEMGYVVEISQLQGFIYQARRAVYNVHFDGSTQFSRSAPQLHLQSPIYGI